MYSFLVVKILDDRSLSIPSTQVYGKVEFRAYQSDSECELEILKDSAVKNGYQFEKFSVCARVATIVKAESEDEAIQMADNLFSQVIDVKFIEYPLSNSQTSNIGYVKNLENGDISPLEQRNVQPSMMFVVNQGSIQRNDTVNFILSLNHDLSQRYKRSLHWSRNSRQEYNKQLKILYYWFALEALFKEDQDDNIGWLVRWFLGFPNGKLYNQISSETILILQSHEKYSFWSSKLINTVEELRIFRNNSVHSGFREADFSIKDLELYHQVMFLSARRGQTAVEKALINGITSLAEFKEYVAVIFEDNSNLINDIHGNVLFTLDKLINKNSNITP